MRIIILHWLVMTMIVLSSCTDREPNELPDLLPATVKGWQEEDRGTGYDQETIFDYIDGAGELYRAFNFGSLWSKRYKQEGAPDLIADVFDMGTSADAYGIFHHDPLGEPAEVGQEGRYHGGLLSAWQDRYFISLYTEEETDAAREALLALGGEITRRIGNKGKVPELVGRLPEKELVPGSVRFFHSHHILNMHFPVAEKNILYLTPLSDGVLGTYNWGGNTGRVVIIRYCCENLTRNGYQGFLRSYLPEGKESGRARMENGKWSGAARGKQMVALVFDAPDEEKLQSILKTILSGKD